MAATCCTCVCILYIYLQSFTQSKLTKNMICACSTYLVKKPADCEALELNEKGLWVRKKKPTTEVRTGEVLQPPFQLRNPIDSRVNVDIWPYRRIAMSRFVN